MSKTRIASLLMQPLPESAVADGDRDAFGCRAFAQMNLTAKTREGTSQCLFPRDAIQLRVSADTLEEGEPLLLKFDVADDGKSVRVWVSGHDLTPCWGDTDIGEYDVVRR